MDDEAISLFVIRAYGPKVTCLLFKYPRADSNGRTRLRRPLLYPN